MTLSLEYALSVNHVGSTPTPGDDMAVAACTDVGYRSGKFEGHSRVGHSTRNQAVSAAGSRMSRYAYEQGGLQNDEAVGRADCKTHCRLIAVTSMATISTRETA